VVVAGLMALAPAAVAQAPEVQRPLDEGFRRVMQNPGDIGVNQAYAKQLLDAGEYEKAIATLERILITDPTQTYVRIEIGSLYFRLGSYEAARSYFQRALADPNLAPELRAQAERFLADIAERLSPHQFNGFASVGARWQANANSGPDSTTLRGGGFLVPRPPSARPESDFSFFGSGRVQHSYDLDTQNDAHIVSTLQGYGNAYTRLSHQDLVLGELTSGVRFKPAPADVKDLQIRPHLIGNYVSLDGDRYLDTFGAGIDVTMTWSERFASELTFEFRHADYGTIPRLGDTQNQTGDGKVVKLRTAYELTSTQTLILDLYYLSKATKRGYYDFTQWQATFTYSLVYEAPFKFGQPSWVVQPYLSWYSQPYGAPDPLINPVQTRFDNQVRIGLVHTIPIAEKWSVYQQVEHLWNDSNIPNYGFQDTSVIVGLTRQF
jgi:hypothetical protein